MCLGASRVSRCGQPRRVGLLRLEHNVGQRPCVVARARQLGWCVAGVQQGHHVRRLHKLQIEDLCGSVGCGYLEYLDRRAAGRVGGVRRAVDVVAVEVCQLIGIGRLVGDAHGAPVKLSHPHDA